MERVNEIFSQIWQRYKVSPNSAWAKSGSRSYKTIGERDKANEVYLKGKFEQSFLINFVENSLSVISGKTINKHAGCRILWKGQNMSNIRTFIADIKSRKMYKNLGDCIVENNNQDYPHLTFQVLNVVDYLRVIELLSKTKI